MLFNSTRFLLFFPIVVVVYYTIPDKIKKMWLLVASYYFYMCWNVKYVLLIFLSTIITYVSGLCIEKSSKIRTRKLEVAASLLLNLAVLFYFKYSNFAVNILSLLLRKIHIQYQFPSFDILLPVGISFYTFQALGYTIDVYRGDIYAEKNFFQYALFVSFFPQLVAGPIERSKNLLKQLAVPRKIRFESARDGFLLMLWGYFLKIVLADRIAIFVDTIYGDYMTYGGWYMIIATMLFAFQIYCDFYGYSVIAMGAAEILGIQLMENFHAPYLSSSVSEFWRNWHISLTSWFKDYLYISLGGSHKGKWRKYLNKLVVFLVSGLWHGAKFSFVAWGGLNGIYQIIGEMLKPLRDWSVQALHLKRDSLGHRLLHIVGTFLLVDFSWIFFRANKFQEAFQIIQQMVMTNNLWVLFDDSLYQCGLDGKNFRFMLLCLCVLLFADFCKHRGIQIRKILMAQDFWFRCMTIVFAIGIILTFGIWGPGYNEANFIYFQF